MPTTETKHFLFGFFIKTIIPAFLVILLFIITFFYIFIPAFERKIIADKKEMIKDLTDTAWSILAETEQEVKDGKWTEKQGQHEAVERIKALRYGNKLKDYFWITDLHPHMIVHPYQPELNGKDLTDYMGYNNRKIFVEFAELAQKDGGGFVRYKWQWKDDATRIAQKLSYVKEFKPWGWIIGTGIYLNDVNEEIADLEQKLTIVSVIIILLNIALLSVTAVHSLKTEQKKSQAEIELLESKEKYKMLVGASTEGLIMLLDDEYFFANDIVLKMLQFSLDEFIEQDVLKLKDKSCDLIADIENQEHIETTLPRKDGTAINVLLLSSQITFSGQKGYVIIVKDVSNERERERKKIEEERENLIIELQTSLLFLNQPVSKFMKDVIACNMNTSIEDAAKTFARKNSNAMLLTTDNGDYIGIVTDHDITTRSLAQGHDVKRPVFDIMSSPIITTSENALIFEAAILMQEKGVRHLAVKNSSNQIVSLIDIIELLQIQKYSSASLLQEVEAAQTLEDVIERHERMPLIVKALIDSGAKPRNVTRLIASVSNIVLEKVIKLVIEKHGEPPAKFAFITLGSEGREEETLITDQDNGIIFEDVDKDKLPEVQQYFLKLGTEISEWLNKAGYSFCQGKIMASNEKWCQPLSKWKTCFSKWITNATPQALLEFNIFFDFRHSYGERQLVDDLGQFIASILKDNKAFFIHLAQDCLLYKPPVNLFGNIAVKTNGEHSNTFSIKEAMKPLVNFARIYALENGLEQTNTLERLGKLFEIGILNEDSYRDITEAYEYLMKLRFEHQAKAVNENRMPDNHINPKDLTHIEQEALKKVFSQISVFQSKLSFHFRGAA